MQKSYTAKPATPRIDATGSIFLTGNKILKNFVKNY